MNTKVDIQEFFIEGNDDKASHVLLHIAEPVTPEEQQRGYFFALAEINNSSPEQIEQLQQVIDEIESGYYDTSAPYHETMFEQILQRVNRQSHQLVQYTDSDIHCVVGALNNKKLTLAYRGSPTASLFYPDAESFKEAKIIDGESELTEQLFSAVAEGIINEGDYIYCTTPHVEQYFSSDRVRKILPGRTTRQTSAHIQKSLDSLKNEYSFGGLFLHLPRLAVNAVVAKKAPQYEEGSEASMNNLLNTTRSTAETLSPPVLKHMKGSIQSFLKKNKEHIPEDQPTTKKYGSIETNYRPSSHIPQDTVGNKFLIGLGHGLVFVGKGLYIIAKKITIAIGRGSVYFFYMVTNRHGRRTLMMDMTRSYLHTKRGTFTDLGMGAKVLSIALMALVILFVGSIAYLKVKEHNEAKRAQYESTVDSITEKKNEAESRLLYGEETKALGLLHEAQQMLQNLPQDNDTEKTTFNQLNQDIDGVLNKLRKISSVDAQLVVDLVQTNTAVQTDKLVLLGDKVMAFGSTDTNIYSVDPVTKQVEIKKHDTIPSLSYGDVPKENDKIIFTVPPDRIAEYDSQTQALVAKDISFPTQDVAITDITSYSRRIYVLDPSHEQIYKHNPTQTGYDRGASWITQKTSSLKDAVALSVDGDMFVLTNNSILKFTAGEEQSFTINGLDPALNKASDIWTYADANNLYIIEPTNKRVILIDKEGNFKGQYTSSLWTNPTGIAVQEKNKTIFVLDNNKVYQFTF
ncbi:MAG: hypothetical protein WCW16_01290 [Candidatus Magasanikbacteria bacterium]